MFGLFDIPKMVGAAAIAALITWAITAPVQYAKGKATGRAAVVEEVTKRNQAAGVEAQKVKSRIDECDERGGTWDQETGTCAD